MANVGVVPDCPTVFDGKAQNIQDDLRFWPSPEVSGKTKSIRLQLQAVRVSFPGWLRSLLQREVKSKGIWS